ncbi:glycosyltransferase family 2 protein, partial [Vibrio anguillarum]
SISSVIITFQPDLSNVSQLLFACISFGNKAVVIDNGSNNAEELQDICRLFEHVKLIRLDENVGIASAQNIAISNLNGNEDDIIVFFDQDSSIDNGYLSKVELAYNRLESDFGRGIVLGPRFYNRVSKFEYPVIKFNIFGLRSRIYPSESRYPIEASCIISSGMAVRKNILDSVGVMDDSLFIDYVDTEWSLRARYLGNLILVDPQLVMGHEIGTDNLKLFKWRVPVHSASRRYYRIRNSFFLFRYPHIPRLVCTREVTFSILHQLFLVLLTNEKKAHWKSLWR